MNYDEFLTRIIDDGIAAARLDYEDSPEKLAGAVEGFEACRGKTPVQLAELLGKARAATGRAYFRKESDYWRIRCFEAEIEWVCNCISAAQMNGNQSTIVPPTARAVIKTAEILGVSGA